MPFIDHYDTFHNHTIPTHLSNLYLLPNFLTIQTIDWEGSGPGTSCIIYTLIKVTNEWYRKFGTPPTFLLYFICSFIPFFPPLYYLKKIYFYLFTPLTSLLIIIIYIYFFVFFHRVHLYYITFCLLSVSILYNFNNSQIKKGFKKYRSRCVTDRKKSRNLSIEAYKKVIEKSVLFSITGKRL